jgi:hypothetical protein
MPCTSDSSLLLLIPPQDESPAQPSDHILTAPIITATDDTNTMASRSIRTVSNGLLMNVILDSLRIPRFFRRLSSGNAVGYLKSVNGWSKEGRRLDKTRPNLPLRYLILR